MRRLLTSVALLTMLCGAGAVAAAPAAPTPEAVAHDPETIRQLAGAWDDAATGKAKRDPAPLLRSARTILTLQRKGIDLRGLPPSLAPRATLAAARTLLQHRPPEDALVGELATLEEIEAAGSRGLLTRAVIEVHNAVAQRGRPWFLQINGKAGEVISVRALMHERGDITFAVTDDRGQSICRQRERGFSLGCDFTPDHDGSFRLVVAVMGGAPVRFDVIGS